MMAGIVARPAWKGRWIDFAICGCSGFQYDVSLNTLRRRTGARQKAFYEPGALIEGNESDASTATGLTANSPNDLDKPDDLTLDLFSQMVESGLIPQNRRVFLLDGKLFDQTPKSKAHGSVGASITMILVPRLRARYADTQILSAHFT